MATVHCLGVAVIDAISGPLEHYPVPGTHPQVNAQHVEIMPGGGAVNTAATLAHLGVSTSLYTRIGDDQNGRTITKTLQRYGVNTNGVCVSNATTTPYTFVGLHPDGQRTFIHTPGANLAFTRKDIDVAGLLACNILVYQDLNVMPLLDGDPAADILRHAREQGVTTILDMCWGLGPNSDTLKKVLAHVDIFMPSIEDLQAMFKTLSKQELVAQCHAMGARQVVLKLGVEGCLISNDSESMSIPAMPAEVVDTTGAGDAFDAGYIQGLIEGKAPHACAMMAAQTAARRIQVRGGSTPLPK